MTTMAMLPFLALLLTVFLEVAPRNPNSEVWSIDQSDSAGKNYGGTIYIWDAKDLERVNKAAAAEKVDLGGLPRRCAWRRPGPTRSGLTC